MNKKVLFVVQGAMIAALYVVLTLVANALGLANYAIQVRFSEALTILPLFTPAAIPGLFLGCIISNTATGCHILDIVCGSSATLIGAVCTWYIGRKLEKRIPMSALRILGAIPPIVANTLIIPPVLIALSDVYHLEGSYLFFTVTVCIGEIISCGILGFILHLALTPHRVRIFGADPVRKAPEQKEKNDPESITA
ncbi:MAG: QueT transporter family protein [Lachnospiraceae bacterium]|nr:QueT transporter family protein [Lachnospiraceae bacterium]